MQREEKSERSRRQVLDAALQLFSHQGYRATTVREIAVAARVSTGNVYHHFPDKETIFRSLLDEFWRITETRRYPPLSVHPRPVRRPVPRQHRAARVGRARFHP